MRQGFYETAVPILLMVLLCRHLPAQTAGQSFSYEKEAFRHVATELQNRKVVALADFAHENAYPFHTLIQVLSHWLDRAPQAGAELTVALEADDRMAETLRGYLATGDLEPVLGYLLPYLAMDRLEFYHALRDFHLRLQRLNEKRGKDERIAFHVLGLEPFSLWSSVSDSEADALAAAQAGDSANERDRRSAAKLMAHLKAHPTGKVLLFYGMDHLRTSRTEQSWAHRRFGASQTWQPLACTLKQELGNDFLSVAQTHFPASARSPGSSYNNLTHQDVFIKSADVPWKVTQIDPRGFDAVIFLSSRQIDEAHSLKYICSRRILEQALDRLESIEKQPSNPFAMMYAARTIDGLRFITGQSCETAAQWRKWAQQNPYDGFARIDSNDFADTVRRECGKPMNRGHSAMLGSIGLPPAFCGRPQQIASDEWLSGPWKKLQPQIRFLQCLGLFWIGTPAEKKKAEEYLIQFSGQKDESPEMYLRWYRKTCLGLTY